jgi:hypothetical protein
LKFRIEAAANKLSFTGVKSGRVTKTLKNGANGSFSSSPVKREIVWGDENFMNGNSADVDAEVTLDSDEYA